MRTINLLLTLAAIYVLVLSGLASATTVTDNEMTVASKWLAARFGVVGESLPPFSFTYGGKRSAELLPKWKQTRRVRELDDRRVELTLIWSDPDSGLVVTVPPSCIATFPLSSGRCTSRTRGRLIRRSCRTSSRWM